MPTQTFPGNLDSLAPIRGLVRSAAEQAGLDGKAAYNLTLAVDEVATNIVTHGYEEAGRSGHIEVQIVTDEEQLRVTLVDSAAPFDPRSVRPPEHTELHQPLEDRAVGGLGLMLAFRAVDAFDYERMGHNNRNTLTVHRHSRAD